MSPLPNGGVSVFLHELGICLLVPGNDPENIQPVLQTQITPMLHPRASRTSKTFSEKIIQSIQNVFQDNNKLVLNSEPVALFKHGQQHFYLADFFQNNFLTVEAPSISIKSLTPLLSKDSSSTGIYRWILIGDTHANSIQTVITYSASNGQVTFDKLESKNSPTLEFSSFARGWEGLKSEKWFVGDTFLWNLANPFKPPLNQVAEWPGSSRLHAAALGLSADGNGQIKLWPRSESLTARQTLIPGNNFAPSFVVNGIQDSRKGRFHLDSQFTDLGGNPILEVVNTRTHSVKEISLASVAKTSKDEESFQLGALISVTTIQSPSGSWSLAATLDSYGTIRFFEMDVKSLTANMASWQQMMGLSSSENTNGKLSEQRDSEGKSKPRFGVDKPKHGKEDEKNEPHVGGNTWAGGTGGSDTAGLGGRGGELVCLRSPIIYLRALSTG